LSPEVSALYEGTAKSQGFVMNLSRAWAWRPDVFQAFGALRGQLSANMPKREQAVIVCAMASQLGDSYCSLAWGKTLAQEVGPDAAAAVIKGHADATLAARDTALAQWTREVVSDPNATQQADVDRLRAAGFSDKEIFEATVFVAFRLAFSTVNDALGIAPDWQLVEAAPPQVRDSVDYGRQPSVAPAS
jgi:uncharacterized peroxidase-related enzyme